MSRSPDLLRRVALAAVVANIGIVITGGAVRLTGSGLGCPTWPRCTPESYVTTPEMGIYGVIEFGNRMLTFAVGLIVVAGFVLAVITRPVRRRLIILAALTAAVIPAQAVIGGLTVLTNLNPWVVGLHFLASMGAIAAAYAFWIATREPDGPSLPTVPAALRQLVAVILVATGAVLVLGTVVTGSGPHAGDADARRTGLDPESITQLHTDAVLLLLGLTVAVWFAARAVDAPVRLRRAAGALLLIELAQGLIGLVQYLTQLQPVLVGAHLAGACLVWVAALALGYASRTRLDEPAPPGQASRVATAEANLSAAPSA